MKLADLNNDVNSIAVQLEEKYNRSVRPAMNLNPENVSEIVLSFVISTAPKLDVDGTDIVKDIVKQAVDEVMNEAQS